MSFLDDLVDFGKGAADIHQQVKTTDAISKDGLARIGVRPETIADQRAVGAASQSGFVRGAGDMKSPNINVLGLQMSKAALMNTAVVVGALYALKRFA